MMDESKFSLWRVCFSFCHIDFEVCGEEKKWMEDKLDFLKLSPDQEKILREDMDNPPNILSLIPLITKPADRSFLVHQLRVLSHLDNDFSENEKIKLKKINDFVISKADLERAKEEVWMDELQSYHEDEVYKNHNKHSLFEAVFNSFRRTINPGDYKFPTGSNPKK